MSQRIEPGSGVDTLFNEISQDIFNSSLSLFKKSLLLKQLYNNYVKQPVNTKYIIDKDKKILLEQIFRKKHWLNKKERAFVAEKCGLSPRQVRVWFINKRTRSK
ncbi:hypothetical protein NCAS_0A15350 [Naumovozyma castellii]|uniref:Homeobox domain-containing protein n=1 Tax=Naumovozyma castellii TaxID=27288 RepID=G0V9E2_NAUCA|nr:hypothetical protein NCAS_0A15350 [Naumovozyma castellii CBS 4309]CCC68093.1 hypothetical protein NCAS_0A15350 [Naumovozyma castellii CBS 4309]